MDETGSFLSAPPGWWITAAEGRTRIVNMTDSHLLGALFYLRRGALELHAIEVDCAFTQAQLSRGKLRADKHLYAAALRAADPWAFLDTVPKYAEIESEALRRGLL